jgi:hypothetical protein
MEQHITSVTVDTWGATASCVCKWSREYRVGDVVGCDEHPVTVTADNAEALATQRARVHRMVRGEG